MGSNPERIVNLLLIVGTWLPETASSSRPLTVLVEAWLSDHTCCVFCIARKDSHILFVPSEKTEKKSMNRVIRVLSNHQHIKTMLNVQ